ncbi:hypothetical protein G8767_22185 [Rhodococcus sp. IC4_135]|uniref:hypothetical protein n=1 Tax=Rhodococcus sp. IC4_135 TaxID=2715537 RepID=UPI0014208C3E|nr:hypothetical protein [Rhodococcus sp. IC4_135]
MVARLREVPDKSDPRFSDIFNDLLAHEYLPDEVKDLLRSANAASFASAVDCTGTRRVLDGYSTPEPARLRRFRAKTTQRAIHAAVKGRIEPSMELAAMLLDTDADLVDDDLGAIGHERALTCMNKCGASAEAEGI